jgi:hypothetical protein
LVPLQTQFVVAGLFAHLQTVEVEKARVEGIPGLVGQVSGQNDTEDMRIDSTTVSTALRPLNRVHQRPDQGFALLGWVNGHRLYPWRLHARFTERHQ